MGFSTNGGYAQIIHFNGIFPYKPSRVPPWLWKPPHVLRTSTKKGSELRTGLMGFATEHVHPNCEDGSKPSNCSRGIGDWKMFSGLVSPTEKLVLLVGCCQVCCRVRLQLASAHKDLGSFKNMLSGGVSVSPVLKKLRADAKKWENGVIPMGARLIAKVPLLMSYHLSHLPIENLSCQVKDHEFTFIYCIFIHNSCIHVWT